MQMVRLNVSTLSRNFFLIFFAESGVEVATEMDASFNRRYIKTKLEHGLARIWQVCLFGGSERGVIIMFL